MRLGACWIGVNLGGRLPVGTPLTISDLHRRRLLALACLLLGSSVVDHLLQICTLLLALLGHDLIFFFCLHVRLQFQVALLLQLSVRRLDFDCVIL